MTRAIPTWGAVLLAIALSCATAGVCAASGGSDLAGLWRVVGRADTVLVEGSGEGIYHLRGSRAWQGIGFFDGKSYRGVFRIRGGTVGGLAPGTVGTQRAVLAGQDRLLIDFQPDDEQRPGFVEAWLRLAAAPGSPRHEVRPPTRRMR